MISEVRQNYRVLLPGLLLGASSLLVLAFLGNVNRLGGIFGQFNWLYLLLAVALTFVYHGLRFINLNFSLNVTGIKNIAFKKRLTFYLSSSALNATDQHTNESIRTIWVSRACGIPFNRIDSLFLIDGVSASISFLVLAILGIIAYPAFWPFFAALFGLLVLMLLFLQNKPVGDDVLDAGEKIPFLRQLTLRLRATIADNEKMFKAIPITVSLLLNVLAWLTQALTLFIILVGLGLPAELSLASIACLVLAFSIMIGFLSNMPGGLGVVELALAGLLSVLLGYQPEIAVTATILFRLTTFWISLLFGILFWPTAARSCTANPGAPTIAES